MKIKAFQFIIYCLISIQCFGFDACQADVTVDTLTFFDPARGRKIPIAIYSTTNKGIENKIPVIISHGYGQNKGGDYLRYSFLANSLAEKGYFVISIHHELATDLLIPTVGNPQSVRKPFWVAGVQNISFVVTKTKKQYKDLNFKKLVLIGHSNGGDTSLLFADKHPDKVEKVISLDNRRMAFPRKLKPQMYSIRSNDSPADEGVLPNEQEKKEYGITIDNSTINHNNMSDKANETERKYIVAKVFEYIEK